MQKLRLVDEEGQTVAFQLSPDYLDHIEEEAKILKVSRGLRGPQNFLPKEDLIRFYFNQKGPKSIESRHFETLEEVTDILSIPTQSPTRLFDIVTELQWLTIVVTLKWDELSEYDREQLAIFAYKAIQEVKTPPVKLLCDRAVGVARILGLLLAGEVEIFATYVLNHTQLTSAILDQIERSNPEYQAVIGMAVAEAFREEAASMLGKLPKLRIRDTFDDLEPETSDLDEEDEVILDGAQIPRPLQKGKR